jgi:stage V sporulation protein G
MNAPQLVTDVRIKLTDEPARDGHPRVVAYASIAIGDVFVVHDVKLLVNGREYFVAMPSKRIADRCPGCEAKNHLKARFCNYCGIRLGDGRAAMGSKGRERLFADLAHPIDRGVRSEVEAAVIAAYRQAVHEAAPMSNRVRLVREAS